MTTILLAHGLSSLRPTRHNGPGWRIPLWTQGCTIRCTAKCINRDFLGAGGRRYAVREVVHEVVAAIGKSPHPIDGITILGGEPTDQADAVAEVLESLRMLGLTTMVYTGAVAEELPDTPEIRRLMAATDVLVDGPFLADNYDPKLIWRGSTNQRFLFLSDAFSEEEFELARNTQGLSASVHRSADGAWSISGLQGESAARAAESVLADLLR